MAENETQDVGLLILGELKTISRLLGAINQNINKQLQPMKGDLEMCKVNLNKLRKMGPPEVVVNQDSSQAAPVGPAPGPEGLG